jgi:hypothetical protein
MPAASPVRKKTTNISAAQTFWLGQHVSIRHFRMHGPPTNLGSVVEKFIEGCDVVHTSNKKVILLLADPPGGSGRR